LKRLPARHAAPAVTGASASARSNHASEPGIQPRRDDARTAGDGYFTNDLQES